MFETPKNLELVKGIKKLQRVGKSHLEAGCYARIHAAAAVCLAACPRNVVQTWTEGGAVRPEGAERGAVICLGALMLLFPPST